MKEKDINNWVKKRQEHLKKMNPDGIFDGIKRGDRVALSTGITLVESQNPAHREDANALVQRCLKISGNSVRIGITGVPGVGKSTFIESFGKVLTGKGHQLAVLAVDPTSSISGGSILGDKTRMHDLSVNENAFIRPSPAGDTLGGVARKTRETIILCEAAGFDVILIETVGVGQSETVVKSMVDFFLLLMLSGAGDELQGIKKGIMEMADALVITKADGDNVKKAQMAAREYKNAMHLFPPNENEWIPQVKTCSSYTNEGVAEVWSIIESFQNQVKLNGFFEKIRHEQDKMWLTETLKEMLLSDFFSNAEMLSTLKKMQKQVANGELSPFLAAEKIYQFYKK
ncbi:MAG: methylmalonyl Co-A mutase-associated GTPase MeaB [Fluviicola sp.]|nr:methylmalonyl Co-A mutase-associated GTPase MeaB [Fluviicola sp.]